MNTVHKLSRGLNHERHRQLFDTFGTTMVYVALPAIVEARMCVNGEVETGLIIPDNLDPQKFFAGMEARGVPFEFKDRVSPITEGIT